MQIVLKCTSVQSFIQGKKIKYTAVLVGKDQFISLPCEKNQFKPMKKYKITIEDVK